MSTLKEVFRPTFLRCIIPVLIFVLIMVSFVRNSYDMPKFGEYDCKVTKFSRSSVQDHQMIMQMQNTNNPDANLLVNQLKEQYSKENDFYREIRDDSQFLIASAKREVAFNLFYLGAIHNLNPFFPAPCDLHYFNGWNTISSDSCRFYITESGYDCIFGSNYSERSALMGDMPDYNRISFFAIFFHTILLMMILYVLVCVISFANKKLSEHSNMLKLAINSQVALFSIVILIFFIMLDQYGYVVTFASATVIFIIASYIKSDKTRKMFSYAILVLLCLAYISTIFVLMYNFSMDMDRSSKASIVGEPIIEYKVIGCNNTKIMTLDEKMYRVPNELLYEQWKICDNPDCYTICEENCDTQRVERNGLLITTRSEYLRLRGDKPSCVCQCITKTQSFEAKMQ